MDRVRRTIFDPLLTSKAAIRRLLQDLPIGTAHPYSPESLLLCRIEGRVCEIDISLYADDFFFNAVDLGAMGETLQRRMDGFKSHLSQFDDYQIMQAPAASFTVPIVPSKISILAVSERTPTYYDLCLGDISNKTCCYNARSSFFGISHSGDVVKHNDFLAFISIDHHHVMADEICVFISGYRRTRISMFQKTHPALLVADHYTKSLYIVPVPLDAATIGDATICCPLVVKKDRNWLLCSILPTAATDRDKMCGGASMDTHCFKEAIERADFNVLGPRRHAITANSSNMADDASACIEQLQLTTQATESTAKTAVIATRSAEYPSFLDLNSAQVIEFGTGLQFKPRQRGSASASQKHSKVVLPCLFGSTLKGPVLLATGSVPDNVPFRSATALRRYYEQLENVVVIVDESMTDNARNLADAYRINALFIVQLQPKVKPQNTDDVLALMNSANINAVTALAGPQSLVVVQISGNFFFYRGMANQDYLKTSDLIFGSDVTSAILSAGSRSILDPRVARVVNLESENSILLPTSGELVQRAHLQELFTKASLVEILDRGDDISAAVPQLQMLLGQKDLQDLSQSLVGVLTSKISEQVAPLRRTYIEILAGRNNYTDPAEWTKQRNSALGSLRKGTKTYQTMLSPIISSLATMMSSQTTSKRTHDIKRLERQAQIQGNVAAAGSMTHQSIAEYLETDAAEMGVLLLNINAEPYRQLLESLSKPTIDASQACDLDSRMLYLEGLTAGIILQQTQGHHTGPLTSQMGPSHPILGLPNLNQGREGESTLAWVCWDEFVDLSSPYKVRWMEKCNEKHIAAFRIIMRDTLSKAIASREYDLQPSSAEIGHLMSALLMAAMSKLTARISMAPATAEKADDTVTRLMRGLFGNLMTIAGSGVRPMSMVWQLFGVDPNYDIPANDTDWIWYETTVSLYPYTGWPVEQFHKNLEKLLDKLIVRVVIRYERTGVVKENRVENMIRYCKLRNIELVHSRTIITTFMRMLTTDGLDVAAVAQRLLEQLPTRVERQTRNYTNMLTYLVHLAEGGEQLPSRHVVAANTYTRRSGVFQNVKTAVSEAAKAREWARVKESCQALLDERASIAALWKIDPEELKIQNIQTYVDLLDADFGEDAGPDIKERNRNLIGRVTGDAERKRAAWQVGKEGEFGPKLEPLDEAFVHDMLTGEKSEVGDDEASEQVSEQVSGPSTDATSKASAGDEDFGQLINVLAAHFVFEMQDEQLSPEGVCKILKVAPAAMKVFTKALSPNPEAVWADLGQSFKHVIFWLVKNRTNRLESRPARKLLEFKGAHKALED